MSRATRTDPLRRVVAFALLPFLIATTGCALTVKGTVQSVPVDSTPLGAEVFVDGDFVGLTPITVELEATEQHLIVVRLGEQEREMLLVNQPGALWVTLDAVPAALGAAALIGVVATPCEGEECLLFVVAAPFAIGLALIGVTPIVIDASTGAWHELSPGEVTVNFE